MKCLTCSSFSFERIIMVPCISCNTLIHRCIGCRREGIRYTCDVCFSLGYQF